MDTHAPCPVCTAAAAARKAPNEAGHSKQRRCSFQGHESTPQHQRSAISNANTQNFLGKSDIYPNFAKQIFGSSHCWFPSVTYRPLHVGVRPTIPKSFHLSIMISVARTVHQQISTNPTQDVHPKHQGEMIKVPYCLTAGSWGYDRASWPSLLLFKYVSVMLALQHDREPWTVPRDNLPDLGGLCIQNSVGFVPKCIYPDQYTLLFAYIISIYSIYTLYTICILRIIEGSLEVKLPTIWRDGKAEVGRVREEKIRDGEDQRGRKSEERRCFTPYHPAPGASSRRLCQGCATRAFDDLVLFDGSHRNTLEVQVKSVKNWEFGPLFDVQKSKKWTLTNLTNLTHLTTLTNYTTLHPTTPHYTTLRYTTLHYTTVHDTSLHYITPHYTTLHYTAI